MIVEMYMSRDVEVISPDATLLDGIRKMSKRRIRRLVVTKGPTILGLVTSRDIVEAFPPHINPFSAVGVEQTQITGTIDSIMKLRVRTVEQHEPIEYAAELMNEHHIGCLPVTSQGQLVGIITESDIFRTFAQILTAGESGVRITFDVTEREKILTFLEDTSHALNLNLLSFVTFHSNDRRLAVARVEGAQVDKLVDKLWESGHRVVNVLRPKPPE